ncbi:MAG: hypothetical protein U0W24_19750 [Bacteroidales bacterium]
MMQTKIVFFILLSIFIINSTEAQIIEYSSDYNKIANSRNTILSQIKEDRIDSISFKRFFQLDKEENSCLTIAEIETLLLLKGQFEELLNDINTIKTSYSNKYRMRILSNSAKDIKAKFKYVTRNFKTDKLSESLKKTLKLKKEEINMNIDSLKLNEDKKKFLALYIDYCLFTMDYCSSSLEKKILKNSAKFTEQFPNSIYNHFIDDYINIEYTTSNWKAGIYSSISTTFFPAGLNDYIPPLLYLQLMFDLSYKKIQLNFGIGGNSGELLKKDLILDTIYKRGNKLSSINPEANISFPVFDKKKLRIAPCIGVRLYLIDIASDSNESIDFLTSNNSIFLGFIFDYRIIKTICNPNFRGSDKISLFSDLRLTFSYQNSKFNNIIPHQINNLWQISLGFGINESNSKRLPKRHVKNKL